jgi:hypothetical protein
MQASAAPTQASAPPTQPQSFDLPAYVVVMEALLGADLAGARAQLHRPARARPAWQSLRADCGWGEHGETLTTRSFDLEIVTGWNDYSP